MRKWRAVLASIGFAAFVFVPAPPVNADPVFGDVCDNPDAQDSSVCEADGGDPVTGDEGVISRIINVAAAIAGILAVLLIMWGGFTYITSGGDTQKATTARQTIIYAVVGLVVIVLAQTIISFILTRVL